MNRRLERVNVASLRVALISTGVVAVVYAIVAMLVVAASTVPTYSPSRSTVTRSAICFSSSILCEI